NVALGLILGGLITTGERELVRCIFVSATTETVHSACRKNDRSFSSGIIFHIGQCTVPCGTRLNQSSEKVALGFLYIPHPGEVIALFFRHPFEARPGRYVIARGRFSVSEPFIDFYSCFTASSEPVVI